MRLAHRPQPPPGHPRRPNSRHDHRQHQCTKHRPVGCVQIAKRRIRLGRGYLNRHTQIGLKHPAPGPAHFDTTIAPVSVEDDAALLRGVLEVSARKGAGHQPGKRSRGRLGRRFSVTRFPAEGGRAAEQSGCFSHAVIRNRTARLELTEKAALGG